MYNVLKLSRLTFYNFIEDNKISYIYFGFIGVYIPIYLYIGSFKKF